MWNGISMTRLQRSSDMHHTSAFTINLPWSITIPSLHIMTLFDAAIRHEKHVTFSTSNDPIRRSKLLFEKYNTRTLIG